MDVKSILKAKQAYDTKAKQLEAIRYAQLDEFRNQFGEELIVRMEKMPSLEIHMATLNKVDRAVAVLEKILAGTDVSSEEFEQALGCSKAEYDALRAEYDPVVKPVPEKLVLMTFDDATIDHYTTVAPIFEKYGGKANFFVSEVKERLGGGPGFEDKSLFMTWEQIRELADRGHEIVNHSWKHTPEFFGGDADYLQEQIVTIDQRCEEYGIRKPIAFGYPGGQCLTRHELAIQQEGYRWARGDLKDVTPVREGQSFYDPYMDSPLSMPSYNGAPGFDEARIAEVLGYATGGRVLIFTYHTANGPEFKTMTLEEQVRCIYENGGRCITYTELEEYIDPVKAYRYTHM